MSSAAPGPDDEASLDAQEPIQAPIRGRGSIAVMMAALMLVAVVAGLLAADVGIFLTARAQAQVAADAAALAAAPTTFRPFGADGTPAEEAARFAASNGARLTDCDCARDSTWATRTVRVRVVVAARLFVLGTHEVVAWSAADFTPTALSG